MDGMNSRAKNARIVCRMKSVDVTRVIPSRYAASVATVDFPVPVAADQQHDRQVELLQVMQPLQAAHRACALLLAEHLDGELAQAVEVDLAGVLRQVDLRSACEIVRHLLETPTALRTRAISPFDHGRLAAEEADRAYRRSLIPLPPLPAA